MNLKQVSLAVMALGTGLFLAAVLLWQSGNDLFGSGSGKASVGHAAPKWTLPSLEENSVKLSDYLGKPLVVNFWATWCIPCVEEIPVLTQALIDHQGDLVILSIDSEDSLEDVLQILKENPVNYPILLDLDGQVSESYAITAFPTNFFVDSKGVIQAVNIGQMTEEEFAAQLQKIGIQ